MEGMTSKTSWFVGAALFGCALTLHSSALAQAVEFRASGGGTVIGIGSQSVDAAPPVGVSLEVGVTAGQSSFGLSLGAVESPVGESIATFRASAYYSRSFRPRGLIVPRMTLDLGVAALSELAIFGTSKTHGSVAGSALFGFDIGRGSSRGFLEAGPRFYVPFAAAEHIPNVWVGLHLRLGYRFASR